MDWVDIDEELYTICRQHLKYCDDAVYENTRLSFYPEDIMAFLAPQKGRENLYDAIVIDLIDPDPANCQSNALYGEQFWAAICRSLKHGGGLVSHAGYADTQSSPRNENESANIGLKLIANANKQQGHPYHARIPCFQAEWAFWMSLPPSSDNSFPSECRLMNVDCQNAMFEWSSV